MPRLVDSARTLTTPDPSGEFATRDLAAALCLDRPCFSAHEAPEAFARWQHQVGTVAMLESRGLYLSSEIARANELAKSTTTGEPPCS